ncbi:MAG: hypothetical protein KGV58_00435 [Campylobacteraceae bacterium]|nr:hypothetical protein [Campylobacteraceae bacterium]
MKKIICFSLFLSFLNADMYYFKQGKKVFLKPLLHVKRSISSLDFYENENGFILGIDNTLLVAFRDEKNLEKYIKDYDVRAYKNVFGSLYKFSLSDKTQTIKVANELAQKEDIKYAYPNFYKRRIKR